MNIQLLRYVLLAVMVISFLIMVFGKGRVYFDFSVVLIVGLLLLQIL